MRRVGNVIGRTIVKYITEIKQKTRKASERMMGDWPMMNYPGGGRG